MNKPQPRAVLYTRLSASDDASTSIQRQETDLQELAKREGWDVVRVLVDDGISGRKARANAEEALRVIRDGEADVLAVWKLDRWTRQGLAAVGDLVTTLDASPGALFVALRDGLRSDQASWRIIASVLAEVARMEADNTAMRVKSSRKHLSHNGRYPGGAVPFGYRTAPAPDGPGRVLEIDPREAAIIREVAERVLADESLTSICRDLFARRIPTAKSPARKALQAGRTAEDLETGQWRITTLRVTWTSEHLLGYVKHHGVTITGTDGLPDAIWPPILDYSTLARLKARLGDPRARSGNPPRRRAARLLSGLLYCAYCDKKMHLRKSTGAHGTYGCSSSTAPGSCPVPRISAVPLEDYITERFLAVMGPSPELEIVEVVKDPGTAAELAQVENALQELSASLLDDEADVAVLMAQLSSLKSRRAELRARPASMETVLEPTGRTYREAWEASDDLDAKRRLLTLAIDHIRVSMREERGPQFDASRVEVLWHS